MRQQSTTFEEYTQLHPRSHTNDNTPWTFDEDRQLIHTINVIRPTKLTDWWDVACKMERSYLAVQGRWSLLCSVIGCRTEVEVRDLHWRIDWALLDLAVKKRAMR